MNNRNDSVLKLNPSGFDDLPPREFPSPEEIERYILEARMQRKEFFIGLVVQGAGALGRWLRNGMAKLFTNPDLVDDRQASDPMV